MTARGIMGGKISTIDFVKRVATQVGWNGLKEPKDRKFLSDLKDLLTEYNDAPFTIVEKQIRQSYFHFNKEMGVPEDRIVFFVHCREPKEIQKFVDKIVEFLSFVMPLYQHEGKNHVVVGFGCTGGRHRSAAIAAESSRRLSDAGFKVSLEHRDITKDDRENDDNRA